MSRPTIAFGLAFILVAAFGCAKPAVDEGPAGSESAASTSSDFDSAGLTALYGPEQKGVWVRGHTFNIKPATITHGGTATYITGQLSHALSFRPDDQIYYDIEIADGAVHTIGRRIERGGLAPIVGPIAAAIADYFDVPIDADVATAVFREIGASIDGSWESTVDAIIEDAAFRAAQLHL